MAASPTRSKLPQFLATLYGLAIVYASLQPFANWMAPPAGTPYFLFAPWPPRWVRYDVIVNVVAYAPFGFFVALISRDRTPLASTGSAVVTGGLVSLAMETLQMFLPTRDASTADLVANTTGATAGAALAVVFARTRSAKYALASMRDRWFMAGTDGDLGLALVAIWLAVQVNPGIPLFAAMYDVPPQSGAGAGEPDVAATLVGAAQSAFQLLGVGLFLGLLARRRRYIGVAALLLIGSAMLIKGIAAAVLLKPAAWQSWLTPGVSLGVAGGALLLALAIFLPRPLQVTLTAVALLSSLLATLFAPDLVLARAPVGLFNAPYGHLLNFNGLTHTVLLLWPAVACAFLFMVAGRPRWGAPVT